MMVMQFRTEKLRDDLAKRLSALAVDMIRSTDQGFDHRIGVTAVMIDDIRTAAYLVGMTDVMEGTDERSRAMRGD